MATQVQRIYRDSLARLVAARDALAATLGNDAHAAQRSATIVLTRLVFLRQLQAWGALPDDANLATHINDQTSPFRDLFTGSTAQPLTLVSCQLSDAAPTSDLIGALVEMQGDQKRQGAYYTSADVADYIAAQCIVPALLDSVAQRCPAQFAACWRLIQADPDRYIPAAARHGCDLPLPPDIARGLDDVAARVGWNALAPPSHSLTHEIWREVVARRERYAGLHAALLDGAVCTPNDVIRFNLDGQCFLIDIIDNCENADLLGEWRHALENITILDPTCGSGAFLLAALRVLRPLYAACGRQQRFPTTDAEIIKTIIANNLYGVDILPEAAEACRLRLYLAYAAEARSAAQRCQIPALQRTICIGNILAYDAELSAALPTHFDVIIGNPPYLATSKAAYAVRGYATERCGNLYALVVERALALLRANGRLGVIVPIASVATEAMRPLQQLYAELWQWHSHYAVRPGKLFPAVDMNLTITLLHNTRLGARCWSTGYRRWSGREVSGREHLFSTLAYADIPVFANHTSSLPKLGSLLEAQMLAKMLAHGRKLRDYVIDDGTRLYYHSGGRYWRKAALEQRSSHYKPLCVPENVLPVIFCLLNSQLFYWYWITHSNCMDVVSREVLDLPVAALERADNAIFSRLMHRIIDSYQRSSTVRVRRGQRINVDEINVDARAAKPIIDDIDHALAKWYGFAERETDFVINYDIKYRLARLTAFSGG